MTVDAFTAIGILVVIVTSIWVGLDASGRDWRGARAFADRPSGWVLACLFLWIVFFPMYLAQRNRAPQRASLPQPTVAVPPGWYPDLYGTRRWWDGYQWTSYVEQARRDDTPPRGFPVIRP